MPENVLNSALSIKFNIECTGGRPAEDHKPARAARSRCETAAAAGAGAARVPARLGKPDRRPSLVQSGDGRVDHCAALRLRHPHDRIVWDVGHQTYGHKVLTGRREQMNRMRMWQGCRAFRAVASEMRHLRHCAFEHLHQRRSRHGDGGQARGREAPCRSGDRRRRDDRRHGVRERSITQGRRT